MDTLFLLLVFGWSCLGVTGQNKNYVFVMAPNLIRFNHDEVITACILGPQTNVQFTLSFEYEGRQFSQKTIVVADQETAKKTTLKVTADDLFGNNQNQIKDKGRPKEILLKATGNFGSLSRTIKLSFTPGYLIVQTDKPLYTPRENVNVRVLAMDESLKPVNDIPIIIDIITPSNMSVARRKFDSSPKENGFYRDQLELPPFPEAGIWTAKAAFGGHYQTVGIAPFEVREYVLPTFGVTVSVDSSYILRDKDNVEVTIDATYVYGKKVKGTVGLTIHVVDKKIPGSRTYIFNQDRKELADGQAVYTVDIQSVIRHYNRSFPTGSYLELEADVFERVTGKEERNGDDSIIFADSPYYFEFKRSKIAYRPGNPYLLKVDMFYANGRPAANKNVKAKERNDIEEAVTDAKGQAILTFQTTSGSSDNLRIKVFIDDEANAVVKEVESYDSNHQIVVEKVISNDGVTQLRANTNVNNRVGAYSGILFMVVLRGEVVFTVYRDAANLASANLEDAFLKHISPSARVIAFFVDESTNMLVADAVKFQVDPACRGRQLKVGIQTGQLPVINPGGFLDLNVTGPGGAWVGFNVIDNALLLLNSEHVLKENKIFKELEAHDLGCGVGGGRTTEEVFESTGLKLLSNAQLTPATHEPSDDCKSAKQRWKRSDKCLYGADKKCCDKGKQYAEQVVKEYFATGDVDDMPVPRVICYAKARELAKHTRESLPFKCIMAYLSTCEHVMEEKLNADERSRSILDGENEYAEDIARLSGQGFVLSARTHFQTSFFFEELQLNKEGQKTKKLRFQDSITDWTIQAIGISGNTGACIAEETTVRTFKDFFIQLDLPYKATRLEHFYVKATIFNYDTAKTANVYLEGVDGLCYGGKPGQSSSKTIVSLEANSAKTVRFSMIPLKAGELSITLSALVMESGSFKTDIIQKKLYVVNEGQEIQKSIQICLDPGDQMRDCEDDDRATVFQPIRDGDITTRLTEVDLALPPEGIPGTGKAAAYIEGSAMDTVVRTVITGVEDIFVEPYGCGEQTMITTSPIVFGMFYLRQTGQVTAELEVEGTRRIKKGIDRERVNFQKPDGSYAAHQGRPTSMWLTAFVAKVFCQAANVVDDVVDDQSVIRTLNYISDNIEPDGRFKDSMPVSMSRMQGFISASGNDREFDPSITSFVLIALQECKGRTPNIEIAINDAVSYLEALPAGLYMQNPYFLAITTYALALSNSQMKNEFKRRLLQIKTIDGEKIYWMASNSGPMASYDVETTGYALLAMLQFDDLRTCESIVKWLTKQRKATGIFVSTQDTVVGLQALATYSIRTHVTDVNFDLDVTMGTMRYKTTVTKENTEHQKIIRDIPVEQADNRLSVQVSGIGYGRLNIDLRYNIPWNKEDTCPFELHVETPSEVMNVDVILGEIRNCDVCGKCDEPDNPDYDINIDNMGVQRRKRQADQPNQCPDGEDCDDDNDNVRQVKQKCMRFNVRSSNPDNDAGMSIVKVELETGVTIEQGDLDKLIVEGGNIARIETPSSGRGYIAFYLDKISSEQTHFIFRLVDEFEGDTNTRQVASIKVYDYYNPDAQCMEFYSVGPNHGQTAVAYKCDDESKECECLQSICSPAVEEEIIDRVKETIQMKRRGKSIQTAYQQLYAYSCSPEKANYAVKVKIVNTQYDEERNEKSATATVVASMLQGTEKYDEGDEMTFVWQQNCQHPNMQKDKEYIIIGKDSKIVGNQRRYSLMGTALVIDLAPDGLSNLEKKYLRVVGKKLVEEFKNQNGGCTN